MKAKCTFFSEVLTLGLGLGRHCRHQGDRRGGVQLRPAARGELPCDDNSPWKRSSGSPVVAIHLTLDLKTMMRR